ncbi:hypothetical protein B0H17DRAFT_1134563 [Mycena rosella]|uniref:Uncharacterized protein n=1 Tax=Mycena rosella TaxID=1033263 RepID=A0AAD7DFT6_MYCRO|nr:hypothetical protein B0H17DRAFT_1134563 [Mycena rosella]
MAECGEMHSPDFERSEGRVGGEFAARRTFAKQRYPEVAELGVRGIKHQTGAAAMRISKAPEEMIPAPRSPRASDQAAFAQGGREDGGDSVTGALGGIVGHGDSKGALFNHLRTRPDGDEAPRHVG